MDASQSGSGRIHGDGQQLGPGLLTVETDGSVDAHALVSMAEQAQAFFLGYEAGERLR